MTLPPPASADDAPAIPAQPEEMFPVVAIGASAGGLEAFTQLISHLPTTTGMAFVLLQHLDPNQPSLLSEIMGRTTEMPVLEVLDGVAIAPNHVYVIPHNTAMTIVGGELRLQPRPRSRTGSHVIDNFFNALAEERGTKAIGVVLSGADADGTLGLEAIKAAGGITFAQLETSAQFSSMPHMAIATGQIDFIQTPEEIAQTLASLSAHPYITSPNPADPVAVPQEKVASDTGLDTILTLLKRATKIDFAQYKPNTVKRRISRRMALHHLESLESYSQYLQANPEEVQALHQEILIGVTSFFRDGDVFTALEQTVFPALLRNRQRLAQADQGNPDLPLRIWVAGCSTGEEAYSIAICLLEYLSRHSVSPPIQIFATDVSKLAIEVARMGWYSPVQVSDVSPERLQRFFVPTDGGYQINKVVRELCIFACHNLITDPPFSRLDLISCRNVLIYFRTSLQSKVLPMFHYGLKPSGFLLLGSSETTGEFSHLFSLVDSHYKLYAKQSVSLPLNFDFDPTPYIPSPQSPMPDPPPERSQTIDLYALADQTVLNRYGPAGVLVNDRLEILQFRGQTGAYLEPAPGRASLNLLTMAKEGLRIDLRTAFYQAQQTSQAVQRRSLLIEGGDRRPVQIEVVPLMPQPAGKAYSLVFFTDVVPDGTAAEAALPVSDLENQYWQENLALQQDLDTTRSHLQSIIQEQEATNQDLRAANEEVLSSNEELQSTNEELQTAKEEIQATNEELSTINDELYRRNAETTRISDDFQNLLSSIHIPILMLEDDLRIRRFTPTAAALFNLIPGDVGRPLGDINHRLVIADLEARILAVINTLEQSSQEVQDQEGRWYDLRIRPYRTLDNRIDGAVVVLVDIDSLKRSANQLSQARDYADAIVQTVREALVVLTHDLRVVTANRQFYQTFQVSPSDTEGQLIFDLGNGQWDIPQLRSLLHDLLPQNMQIDDFEVVHNFETIGLQTMWLNARKMTQPNGDDLVLLAIETMSDRAASGE
ncbi:chemotaxis protein CheB [Phormidium tenue]|uniref:protein-glutamate O-methyltransferase n=1 Tax=Phormidium tenue NIES-30 TaxID=549789 RepID=A0A1U7J3H9_9CYAN|nr:chemotaxis protein CheB [Phormidium tenue]MBD2233357.1 PAS domain-containing protein [Phormidium tenue FACHB-1052]OKH46821.1 histidine kinase [Phormidium tenue NIES-30]